MQPLIDGDVLLHEIGWSAEFKDKETGESVLLDADHACDLLKTKIEGICFDVNATQPPIIFLSDDEVLARQQGRTFVKGFRYDYAKTSPYKGNRVNPKPFHFYNLRAEMFANYETVVALHGFEADDVICQHQFKHYDKGEVDNTIICSRDKDLRICPGWHFSWECGKQRSVGPAFTPAQGYLEQKDNGDVLGYGSAFFYYQMLVGDTADHIPGLPNYGKAKAFKLLQGVKTTKEQYKIVKNLYKQELGEKAKDYFLEQASLLWMYFNEERKYVFPR